MTRDPLSPAAVLEGMADALPTHEQGDTTSDLSSSLDCVALFVHACMVNLGFRLLGFNEDQKTEAECARLAPRLPAEWNKSLSSHSFVYAHTQSSMQFVVHADRMGAKIDVRGLATGDERIARFDITARDYVSSSALPLRITLTPEGAEDRTGLPAKLKTLFISEERIQ
ncbi:PI31 proteasome regulator N-terminal-domain-containing protein, partial [Staphylotrichum tortipilum]